MDLQSMIMGALGDKFTSEATKSTGADAESVQKVIQTGLPAILGQMGKKTKKADGADRLNTALNDHDGSLLDNISSVFGDDKQTEGAKILGHVFGNKSGSVASKVGKSAGVDSSTATKILDSLAPVVMAQLGKTKKSKGLDSGDLAGMFNQSKNGGIVNVVLGLATKLFKK
jgi:hypothetical protein